MKEILVGMTVLFIIHSLVRPRPIRIEGFFWILVMALLSHWIGNLLWVWNGH